MLTKRIIPCLDVMDGRVVKGVNFGNLRDSGDPVELAERYSNDLADELVFLDITASSDGRDTVVKMVDSVTSKVFIPLTIGGGIRSADDAARLIEAGADKVSVNSAAVKRPELLNELAARFGSQAVVLAIDAKRVDGNWRVFTHGGRTDEGLDPAQWAQDAVRLGAGEILLTSMDTDGVQSGFDIALTKAVCDAITVPVIAAGGAGQPDHFVDVFKKTEAQAALAASILHFGKYSVSGLKCELLARGVEVRL